MQHLRLASLLLIVCSFTLLCVVRSVIKSLSVDDVVMKIDLTLVSSLMLLTLSCVYLPEGEAM